MLNDNSAKVEMQAMGCLTFLIISQVSIACKKVFLSYNPKHGIYEHGSNLLKYVVHKNALENNIGKW